MGYYDDKFSEKFFNYLISHEEYEENVKELTKANDKHIEEVKKEYGLSNEKYEMYATIVRHCLDYAKIPERAKGNNLFAEEMAQVKSIHSSEISERKYTPKMGHGRLAFNPIAPEFLSLVGDIIDCEEEKASISTRAKNGALLPNEYCTPDCLLGIISKEAYEANYREEVLSWAIGRSELIDIYKDKGIDEEVFNDISYITHIRKTKEYQFSDLEK